ncbi:hypothetical protein MUN82_03885 [Hymenobacter aerilatus]|uniref:Uncharacterized protein n=1 Tax=Hymenobacter aerilatus TaxID=2932251 RepID=A0A8T9T2L8_9BACT|nr:hypothetical protein [Hymenobacter aerilatus]UOR06239.1 hypothetical protein MUN82_03885 [Hymenobacter aerilatus]
MAAPCVPAAGGLTTLLGLLPMAFIIGVQRSTEKRKIVTGISLATGKKGFFFEGLADSNVGRATYTPNRFGGRYLHEVDLVNFANTPENLETIEDMAKTPSVAIIKANDGFYKIFGLGAGLKLSADVYDSANEDLGGGSQETISSAKEGGREDILMVLDDEGNYDEAATRTLFESLFVAVPAA